MSQEDGCVCHSGSICTAACFTQHHVGCVYQGVQKEPMTDKLPPECAHRDLHYLGKNAGVYCRFCGATWKRSPRNHGSHLLLIEERQTEGVLHVSAD